MNMAKSRVCQSQTLRSEFWFCPTGGDSMTTRLSLKVPLATAACRLAAQIVAS